MSRLKELRTSIFWAEGHPYDKAPPKFRESLFHISFYPPSQNAPSGRTGDECEKGIRRSCCLPETLSTCPTRFGEGRFSEQVSEGGCASAGFAEDVKMPRAEARGASLMPA